MLNDFYTLQDLRQEVGTIHCSLSFNAEHEIFSGHFPQQPVVPGVCTMHIVKALLEGAMARKLLLREAPVVKFLQLIIPASAPVISIAWQEKEQGIISASATFKIGDAAVFKMNGIYEAVQ